IAFRFRYSSTWPVTKLMETIPTITHKITAGVNAITDSILILQKSSSTYGFTKGDIKVECENFFETGWDSVGYFLWLLPDYSLDRWHPQRHEPAIHPVLVCMLSGIVGFNFNQRISNRYIIRK